MITGRRADRQSTASEARRLKVVSAAAGIALENTRLFQDARQASVLSPLEDQSAELRTMSFLLRLPATPS